MARKVGFRLACTLLVLFGALGPGACSRSPQKNIVVIVIDTLRADHLGAWGYARPTSPFIDALAASGIRYQRAYSTAPWTQPSIGSMFTGLYPSSHGVLRIGAQLPANALTLAERLAAAGWATGGVVSHTLISDRHDFSQGFEIFDEREALGHAHVSSPAVTDNALEMVDELAETGRPFFLFVHYFDPHFAYQPHSETEFADDRAGRLVGGESMKRLRRLDPKPSADEIQFLIDLYDEEIEYMDRSIGALIAGLKSRGLYGQTTIVLTADHGEEFFERGWLGHTRKLYEEQIHVPLIVKLPGQKRAGQVVEAPVSLIDLTPSVLALAGQPGPTPDEASLPGRPWPGIGASGETPIRPIYAEVSVRPFGSKPPDAERRSANLRSVIVGQDKLIYDHETGSRELYDLAEDPGERNNLAEQEPEKLAELMRALEDSRAVAASQPLDGPVEESEAPRLDDAQRKELQKLGYIDE